MFFLSAGVVTLGNTLFIIFGEGTVQPWNSYWEQQEDEEESKNSDREEIHTDNDK